MKNVVIIHGWGADSSSNWFPWLKKKLKSKEFNVTAPDFPNTQNPQLGDWIDYLDKRITVDQNTILIGHSLGAPFILRYLEHLNDSVIKSAYLVSGFERSLGIFETDNFVINLFDWERIKKSCKKFYVIHSDNDPYIPLNIAKDLAKNLNASLKIIPNGEHLNAPGGYLEFPDLYKLIIQEERA